MRKHRRLGLLNNQFTGVFPLAPASKEINHTVMLTLPHPQNKLRKLL